MCVATRQEWPRTCLRAERVSPVYITSSRRQIGNGSTIHGERPILVSEFLRQAVMTVSTEHHQLKLEQPQNRTRKKNIEAQSPSDQRLCTALTGVLSATTPCTIYNPLLRTPLAAILPGTWLNPIDRPPYSSADSSHHIQKLSIRIGYPV
jgi:hypothetical protein